MTDKRRKRTLATPVFFASRHVVRRCHCSSGVDVVVEEVEVSRAGGDSCSWCGNGSFSFLHLADGMIAVETHA